MPLTSERVEEIFRDCLAATTEGPDIEVVDLITCKVALSRTKLVGHKAEIGAMLRELPPQFRKEGGGGWSFLQACEDRRGNQWTGLHQRMDQLFGLGIATAQAEYLLPREMWAALPGGMPYIVVNVEGGLDDHDQAIMAEALNDTRTIRRSWPKN